MKKEDILLVKKIYELAKKMNRTIKVSTKDDAANLLAYLKGYTSWKEMSFYENKNNENQNQDLFEIEILEEINIPSFNEISWVFNNNFVKNLEKEIVFIRENSFHTQCNPIEFSPIGTYTNLKSNIHVSLANENALIYGMKNENTFEFFQNEVSKLQELQKRSIILGINKDKEEHKILINMLKMKKSIFIGKGQKTKINPMIDFFSLDMIEDFFTVELNEENIFADIWLNVIRIYKEQLNYKITPFFLRESLKIENLIQLMTGLEKNIQLQMKPLINYINKYLDVTYLKEKQTFIISPLSQEKHFKQINKIEKRIIDLINLYNDDIFDFENGLSIFDIYKENNAIVFLDVEKKYSQTYWNMIINLLNLVIKEQHLYLEKNLLPESNYQTPFLIWNSSEIIDKYSMKILVENNNYWKTHLYDINPENNNIEVEAAREIFIKNLRQVLFLRQNIIKLNPLLESRMKEETSFWGVNLFYLSFNELKLLEIDEAILWQYNTNEKVLNGIEDYHLKKIKLNYLEQ
jgi:hypothetical protein